MSTANKFKELVLLKTKFLRNFSISNVFYNYKESKIRKPVPFIAGKFI